MAVRASELLLIIRAQNQASSALRRLGSDLQTLGKGTDLKRAQKQLAINEQNILRQRMNVMKNLNSIESASGKANLANQHALQKIESDRYALGTRAAALQKRSVDLANARVAAENRINRIEAQQAANLASQQAQMRRLSASEAEYMAAQKRADSTVFKSGANAGRIRSPLVAQQLAITEQQYMEQKARLAKLVDAQAGYEAAITRTQAKSASFTQGQAILGRQVQELANDEAALAARSTEVDAAWRKQLATAAELQAELATVDRRLALVRGQQRALSNEIRAQRWTPLITAGSMMEHLARVSTQSGLVIGATFGYMAHSAAKFSTEVGLAATQVANKFGKGATGTLKAQQQISKGIVDILKSGRATASPQEQTAAAYDIFSSMTLKGNQKSQVNQGLSILKQFNEAAIAGQANLAEVTHAGITILNNFGKQGKQAEEMPKFLNRMFASVRYGRTTVDQFVSSLGQVAPAFSGAFGATPKTFDQLAGAMATITRYIPKIGMASAGLSRLTEIFGRPDFIKGFQALFHVDLAPGGHLLPFENLLKAIDKAAPKLKTGGTALQNFLKTVTAAGSTTGKGGTNATVQARRALQVLLEHIGDYRKISKQVIIDNNEFWKSFRTEQQTPGVKWAEFTNQLKAMVIEIGSYAIPAIVKLGEPVAKAVKWFDNLSESTKKQIAQWGTYAAAIMIVGGAVLFIVGAGLKLIGIFGKLGVLGPATIGIIGGIGVATAALHGDIHSLTDAAEAFINALMPHSAWGWITYLGVAGIAAFKLAKAFTAVRDAYAGVALAQGAGGIAGAAGSIGKFTSAFKEARSISLTAGAGELAASFTGIGAAASGLSIAIPVIAGGIALAAGGAYLLERHMKSAREEAEKIAKEQEYINRLAAAPAQSAKQLGGLGGDVRSVLRAREQVDAINKQIAAARKSGAGKDTIQGLYLDRADALDTLDAANRRANKSFDSLTVSIEKQAISLHKISDLSGQIKNLRDQQQMWMKLTLQGMPGADAQYNKVSATIKRLQGDMNTLVKGSKKGATELAKSFTSIVNSLSRAHQIPRATTGQIQDMFKFALSKSRPLTIPEMKAFIQAEVDPKSLRKAQADIRKFITQTRKIQKVQAQLQYDFKTNQQEKALEKGLKVKTTITAPNNTKKVHSTIANVFKKPLVQHVKITPAPSAAYAQGTKIGAAFAEGTAFGITQQQGAVIAAAVALVDKSAAAAKNAGQIKSPSRKFAEEVGKPIGQGIAMGITSQTDLIKAAAFRQVTDVLAYIKSQNLASKTAALSMNLFGGTYLSNRVSAIENFDPQQAKQSAAEAKALTAKIAKEQASLGAGGVRLAGIQQKIATLQGKSSLTPIQSTELKRLQAEEKQYEKTSTAARKYTMARMQIDRIDRAKDIAASKKPPNLTVEDLIKDTQKVGKSYKQFNNDINNLAKRGIPPQLLDDLKGLGSDGAKYIHLLANASDKDLKRFIKAWKEESKQVNASKYITIADLKDMNAAIKSQLKDMASQAAQTMLDTWNGFHDQMQSAFGDLFNGPDDLASMVGDNLKNAQDQYTTDVQNLQDQIVADNKQLADLTTQAIQQAIDQMQQSFGQLFSGDWIQSTQAQTKLQFGQALGFDDLFKDLQDQTTKFDHWQKDLASLAKKVPPALQKALAALGPDALSELDALNGATADQLKQYVALWTKGQKDIKKAAMGVYQTDDFKSQTSAILADLKSVTDQLNKLVVPHALTPADVIDDLQKQSDAFTKYQGVIADLQAKGLPDELLQQLEALGPQGLDYLQALNKMTSSQLSKYVDIWTTSQNKITDATNTMFQTQLQMWEQYGSDIAAAIIAGVATQQDALIEYFTNLFLNLLNGTQIPPPPPPGSGNSNVTGGGVTPSGDGSDQGIQTGHPGRTQPSSFTNGGTSYTINQEVNAHHTEDLLSTLSRATFRFTTVLPDH